MLPTLLLFFLGLCLLIFSLWYRWKKNIMATFKKLGIPGPDPDFLTGNLKEMHAKGLGKCQLEWIEKYGPIVGLFFGTKPAVMVADPELINIIQVKEYVNFNARALPTLNGSFLHRATENSFIFKNYLKWKTYRANISATISANKLKKMVATWHTTIGDFMDQLDKVLREKGQEVDISEYIRFLTIKSFLKSAYSIVLDTELDPTNYDYQSVVRGARVKLDDPLITLELCFPQFEELFYGFRILREKFHHYVSRLPSNFSFGKKLEKFIQFRQKEDTGFNPFDIMQAIIDMRFHEEEPDNYRKKNAISGNSEDIKGLSLKEIVGDSILLLLAGFETTALTLAYLFHLLAHYQDVQDKLREEIRAKLGDQTISYDTLFGLEYMDQVINEVTRLYPATITFTTRLSREEYTYKNYVFPKGTVFWIPTWALHHSAENWEDPEKFDPDRFSPERRGGINPTKFQPFGQGQRICYGQRFALHEIKAAAAELLRRYKIVLGPSSQPEKLELTDYLLFLVPKKNIYVNFVPFREGSSSQDG